MNHTISLPAHSLLGFACRAPARVYQASYKALRKAAIEAAPTETAADATTAAAAAGAGSAAANVDGGPGKAAALPTTVAAHELVLPKGEVGVHLLPIADLPKFDTAYVEGVVAGGIDKGSHKAEASEVKPTGKALPVVLVPGFSTAGAPPSLAIPRELKSATVVFQLGDDDVYTLKLSVTIETQQRAAAQGGGVYRLVKKADDGPVLVHGTVQGLVSVTGCAHFGP